MAGTSGLAGLSLAGRAIRFISTMLDSETFLALQWWWSTSQPQPVNAKR
jgi:hypothetical protein